MTLVMTTKTNPDFKVITKLQIHLKDNYETTAKKKRFYNNLLLSGQY